MRRDTNTSDSDNFEFCFEEAILVEFELIRQNSFKQKSMNGTDTNGKQFKIAN